jgi:hypothetical protein
MITLEGTIAQNWAMDIAGVFSRDPVEWSKSAKAWYAPELHQQESITGLSQLSVLDTMAFPTQVMYPDEYFPMANPVAQKIFDSAVTRIANVFNMTVKHTNFSATMLNGSIYPNAKDSVEHLMLSVATMTLWSSHVAVAEPLISAWASRYQGRFPPVDPQWRREWTTMFNTSTINQPAYDRSLKDKRTAVDWFEKNVLHETSLSCSDSLVVCDHGTSGLPSFREKI